MKRRELERKLRIAGCYLKREGSFHALWINPKTGVTEAIPRHNINDLGKKASCRTLFIIDALNENISQAPNFWKNNLDNIIKDIKKYPNIALIVSVRNGFEKEVLTEKQKKVFVHEEHNGFRFREWYMIPQIHILRLKISLTICFSSDYDGLV